MSTHETHWWIGCGNETIVPLTAWAQTTHPPFNMKIIRAGYYFGAILAHAATEIVKNTTLRKFQKIGSAIETMGNNLVQALFLLKSQTLSVCSSKNMCLDNVVSNCS